MKRLRVKEGMPLEIETPHGPVLRVWARAKRDLSADVVRLGHLGVEILRVRAGDRVYVRRLRATPQPTGRQ
jgi:hypothetical protein